MDGWGAGGVPVVEGADLARLEPAVDAVEVEGVLGRIRSQVSDRRMDWADFVEIRAYVANSPGDGACGRAEGSVAHSTGWRLRARTAIELLLLTFVVCCAGLVSLALDAEVHNVVPERGHS